MRTILKWTAIPVLAAVVACQDSKPDTGLASDLALITGSDIELANTAGAGTAVVSAVENVSMPSRRTTPSPTKRRGTKAPPPEEVEADVSAEEPTGTAQEMVSVSPSDTPVAAEIPAPEAPPVIRPHPIEPRYPVGSGTVYGTGREDGSGTGGVTVIRGGRTGRDPCDIHDRRGAGTVGAAGTVIGILINNRVPGQGTFPRR